MLDLLKKSADRAPEENLYLGVSRARSYREQLSRLPETASPEERARIQVNLGLALLQLGRTEEALLNLEAAYALLEEFPPAVREQARVSLSYYLAGAHIERAMAASCGGSKGSAPCRFPPEPGVVFQGQESAQKAIRFLREVMSLSQPGKPEFMASRLLLNIVSIAAGLQTDLTASEMIPLEAFGSTQGFPRFREIAPELGLDTVNLSGGVSVEDFNGDGWLDILTSTSDPAGQIHYFQSNGDGTFAERTDPAGLTGILGGLNMVSTDYDNDGNRDVLVLRGAWQYREAGRKPNSLLHNNGDGTFTDMTFESGLGEVHYPTQTAGWADYDNDGYLDLYIGNEAAEGQEFPGQLFHNNRNGTFTDVAKAAGVENYRFAKGVAWGDVDEDHFPDLYVSNLGARNRLYHNNRDGTFTDVAESAGVADHINSFPCWFWDFDNDGHLDLFSAGFFQSQPPNRTAAVAASYLGVPTGAETHRLYRGDGEGHFKDVTVSHNLTRIALVMGANFGDLDNDGYPDFYLGTGYPFHDAWLPNIMYRNLQGRGFADVTAAGGFGHLHRGHGVAFADLDNDGDQDVFEQMGGAYPVHAFGNALYENPGFGNHWIKVELAGNRSNRSAQGSRIHVRFMEAGQLRDVYVHVGTGGSFGSNPILQHIGLGRASKIERIEVFWPTSGQTQAFENPPMDSKILIREGAKSFLAVPEKSFSFAAPPKVGPAKPAH